MRVWDCRCPAGDAAISDLVATEYRGGALSLRNSTTFLGRATGPVLFAGIAATTGYEGLLLAGALVALVSAGLTVMASSRGGHAVSTPKEAA